MSESDRGEYIRLRADELAGDPAVSSAVRALWCYRLAAAHTPGSTAHLEREFTEALPLIDDQALRQALRNEFARTVATAAQDARDSAAWWEMYEAEPRSQPVSLELVRGGRDQ